MIRTLCLSAAVALGGLGTVTLAAPDGASAACGWYAIGGCTRQSSGYPNNPMGWYIVNTNNVSGFRRGYYCIASGPQTKRGAQRDRRILRQQWGVSSAYIKRGCE